MQRISRATLAFLVALAGLTALYWGGLAGVPFHPDESTYIFMSADVEKLARQPSEVFWQPERAADARQRYRLLDAPLTRCLIGLARQVTGQPPTPVDWDWSKSWAENAQAGALPGADLLLTARWAGAAWFPLSLLLIYLTGRRMGGEVTGWAAALLLGSSALVLLHTRRAMAEGPLLVGLCLTLWSLAQAEKRPWLVGLAAGLAFCAKHSLAALAPVGLLAVLWSPAVWEEEGSPGRKMRRIAGQVGLYAALYLGVVLLLNPFLWAHPLATVRAAIQARRELAAAQMADRPEQALNTPGRKLVGLIGSVYLTPPIFAETGNYTAQTAQAEAAYLANPFNNLLRSLPAGGVLLALGLFGAITAGVAARTNTPGRRARVLLLAAGGVMALALLATIPFAWQRYYLPMVPFACLWAGYGIQALISGLMVRRKSTPGS